MHKYFGEILAGKRAVITGASRGLGLLMARRFLECGAKVALCAAPNENVIDAVTQLEGLDNAYMVLGFKPNLNNLDELDEMMKQIEQTWEGIDILVNNAGIYPACRFDAYSPELFQKVNNLNVLGTFMVTKSAVKIMEKQKKGVILNTSSMAGIDGAMGNIGYTASKFGVEGLTLGLARELGSKGIRVNGVAPAGIDRTDLEGNLIATNTEMSEEVKMAYQVAEKFAPLGTYHCHPDEIINAFIFLASDAANFISGQTIAVSGACIWPAASPASSMMY